MDICPRGAPGAPLLNAARAEASRRNGAKSKGPRTAEGKARSSQNAMKHGLRARKWVVLAGESETEFKRLEAALVEELAPQGVLETLLAQRVAAAAWRLGRAEQLETQLFAENCPRGRGFGLALIRDCNGARAFDTLLRYRGTTQAELWRTLRTLKALQAERQAQAAPRPIPEAPAPHAPPPAVVAPRGGTVPTPRPDEPKARRDPGDSGGPSATPARLPTTPPAPADMAPAFPTRARNGSASLLAGTALVPIGWRSGG